MELKCTKCLEVKPSTEFYKRKTTRGFRSECKDCEKFRANAWIKANPKRASENNKAWRDANREWVLARHRAWYKANPAKIAVVKQKTKYKHPDKHRARQCVANAVVRGKLFKPDQCSKCKEVKTKRQIQGHHWSYLREHWLDVIWVCHTCHVAVHNGEAL